MYWNKIITWFGLCCWLSTYIVAMYEYILGDINIYDTLIPVLAIMLYFIIFKDELKFNTSNGSKDIKEQGE